MPSFGELLRKLRGVRSQREISEELGMPVTTLSTLENQENIPRGITLKRLADFYGVPMSYFYSAPTVAMKSSESAKEWLLSLREATNFKEGVATHAAPDISQKVKDAISQAINERQNAKTPDND
jgi:transcriptional regulator with XRE-family HTH domain